MPFAPAATIIDRLPTAVTTVLRAHNLSRSFIEHEIAEMTEHRLATTKNRSVIGIMNEFTHLGGAYRLSNGAHDHLALSLWLGKTPCGPFYGDTSVPIAS